MPRVGTKVTWKFHRVESTRGHVIPTHWELTEANVHFGASPLIEPIGSSGAALHWMGWYTYPDGQFQHSRHTKRYAWFERVGKWQYIVTGQCGAVLFLRLRITVRPPKIKHGKTERAKANAYGSLNYGAYIPEASIPVAVRLRYLN